MRIVIAPGGNAAAAARWTDDHRLHTIKAVLVATLG